MKAQSTSGNNLGAAALMIGIVTIVWSIVPVVGAAAFWPSFLGLTMGLVALALALHGQNPKKGIIIAGFVLCMVSTGVSKCW